MKGICGVISVDNSSFDRTKAGSDENQNVWVLLDGCIYNFPQLRRELEGKGHCFKTSQAAECVAHAYEEYGEDCVCRFKGEFAFAIWDKRQNTLVLVRDRLGTKPLLYSYENGHFCFASDFKSILAQANITREVNFPAIHHYLSYSYVPAPLTAFKDIYKLLPGHKLIWREGKVNIERHWDLDFSDTLKITEEQACATILELFTKAIKKRLEDKSVIGAFLSGGTDSSAVVAFMSKMMNQPIKTFSLGFPVRHYDESSYARRMTKIYNTEHYEYVVNYKDLDILPQLVEYYGEPFADSSSLPSYYLMKLASQHIQIGLSGDGGDELFAGYERHWANRWAEDYQKLPNLLKTRIIPWLVRYFPKLNDPKNPLGRAQRFFQAAALPCAQRYLYWTGVFSPELKEKLYTAEFKKQVCELDSTRIISEAFMRSNTSDIVHSSMYVDTMLHLHNDSNVKVDVVSRANSLEVRAPFMDDELFDFVSKLPSHFKVRGRASKYILKKAIADFVPHQNIYRRKMGFAIPIHKWFREESKEILCDHLLSQRCLRRGYFRPEMIKHLVEEHLSGKQNFSSQLWALLMLELWHRNFIDGN